MRPFWQGREDREEFGLRVGNHLAVLRDNLAMGCIRWRVSPDVLTVMGVVLTGFGMAAFATHHQRLAGALIIAAGACDVLDGAVARSSHTANRFGAFLDSVFDRFSDFLLFGGIFLHFYHRQSPGFMAVTSLALTFAVLTSYTRARAESLIPACKAGFMERPERVATVIIGALANHIYVAALIIAFHGAITVMHRMIYVWFALEKNQSLDEWVRGLPRPARAPLSFLFWPYPRGSWQHTLMCSIWVATLILAPAYLT